MFIKGGKILGFLVFFFFGNTVSEIQDYQAKKIKGEKKEKEQAIQTRTKRYESYAPG